MRCIPRLPRQANLEGFDLPGPPTDRLFFALFPDPATAARVSDLAQQLREACGLKGRPLKSDRFHVTLHHLGDFAGVPPHVVEAARAAAASVCFAPFELVFDRAESFDNKRGRNNPFVLQGDEGTQDVIAFQRKLGEAMKKAGLKPDSRFVPHVTLLYDDAAVTAQPVTPPVRWVAREFVLVHSLLGKTQHIVLGRWPLEGNAA